MCRQLVLLAKNDYGQTVFTCEHGTMHISHHHTTVCMGHIDFVCFAQWLTEGNASSLNSSGLWQVQDFSNGQIVVWIGGSGLRLRADEFCALLDLLRGTLERLKTFDWEQISRSPRQQMTGSNFSQN